VKDWLKPNKHHSVWEQQADFLSLAGSLQE
jgi:hypothetical protein